MSANAGEDHPAGKPYRTASSACTSRPRAASALEGKQGIPQRFLSVKQAPPTGKTGKLNLNSRPGCGSASAWSGVRLDQAAAPGLRAFQSEGPWGSTVRCNCSGSPARHRTPAQLRHSQHMLACADSRAREVPSAGGGGGGCRRKEPWRLRRSASLSEGSFCERRRLDCRKAAEEEENIIPFVRSMVRTALMEDVKREMTCFCRDSSPHTSVRRRRNTPSTLVRK